LYESEHETVAVQISEVQFSDSGSLYQQETHTQMTELL